MKHRWYCCYCGSVFDILHYTEDYIIYLDINSCEYAWKYLWRQYKLNKCTIKVYSVFLDVGLRIYKGQLGYMLKCCTSNIHVTFDTNEHLSWKQRSFTLNSRSIYVVTMRNAHWERYTTKNIYIMSNTNNLVCFKLNISIIDLNC